MLARYQVPGTVTVMLIENRDIALMSLPTLLETVRKAFPELLPEGIDEVWFADTTIECTLEFRNLTSAIAKIV